MQINPQLIKKHFEKSLDKYDNNAVVQKLLAEKLAQKTASVKTNFDSILELGCGTGLLTKELTNTLRYNKYTANDLSPKAKYYIGKILENYTFIAGNAQKIKPFGTFDLIASNAMFQWFSDLENTALYYKKYLNDDGILAFTTFSPQNFKEIKALTGFSLNYLTLKETENSLKKNYRILYSEQFEYTMGFQNPLEILAHMKNTGVNSVTAKKWTFLEVKDFCEKYIDTFPNLTLTYSPIIIIAQKI